MISEKLFESAFAYKKTKLWKMLWDTEIFAVRFSDGETGFCSVMGAVGELCALGLYVGAKGFQSLRVVTSGPAMLPELNYHEFLLSLDCLQCAFETKDELSADEAEEVREYARRHGISLRGRNAFPHFVRFRPNCLPWSLQDEKEKLYIHEALDAALEVAGQLETHKKAELGLEAVDESTSSVPLLERKDDGSYAWSRTDLPPDMPVQYPKPQFVNDITAAKLKRLKKSGMWECQVLRFPEPIQDDPEQAPYFPVVLLVVSSAMDQVLPPQLSQHYEENPEELVEKFAELFIEHRFRPAMLSICDERTRALLEDFCARAGIRVRMCEELPALEDAVDSMMSFLGASDPLAEGFEEILDTLLESGDLDLDSMTDEFCQQLASLFEEQDDLPDGLASHQAVPLRLDTGKAERRISGQSYVISVSLGAGCYRHIRISGSDTLEELHEAIQDAFAFDNDHAYAFYLDNKLYGRDRDAYYAPGFGDWDDKSAGDFCLDQLGLAAGRQFKYLFDFGDEWVFQCRVLRVLDEKTDSPAIVRTQGDSPEQY